MPFLAFRQPFPPTLVARKSQRRAMAEQCLLERAKKRCSRKLFLHMPQVAARKYLEQAANDDAAKALLTGAQNREAVSCSSSTKQGACHTAFAQHRGRGYPLHGRTTGQTEADSWPRSFRGVQNGSRRGRGAGARPRPEAGLIGTTCSTASQCCGTSSRTPSSTTSRTPSRQAQFYGPA